MCEKEVAGRVAPESPGANQTNGLKTTQAAHLQKAPERASCGPILTMSTNHLIFSALFFLCSLGSAQEKVLVRAHWEPGKKYVQQTEMQTSSSLTPAPGQTVEQKLTMNQTTGIVVRPETAAPNKRLEVTFETVTGTLDFMGGNYKFDSKDPQAAHPLLRQALSGTAGKSFGLVYDGDDRFVKVIDTEKLSSDGTSITGLAAAADAQQIAKLFQQSLELGYPKEPVAVGEKWSSEEKMMFPQAGEAKVSIESKYAEEVMREGRKHARITFEGKIGSVENAEDVGERRVSLGEGSTVAGQLFFDTERRVVSLSVFLSNITLKISGNSIPMRQQVTTRLASITDQP